VPRFDPATVTELNRVGLLAELPGETLTKLAQRMERQDIEPGSPVVVEGEVGNHFYCVLSGVLAVSNQGGLAPRRVLRPGDYFGEIALAMDVPRTASVTALTAVTVASCDRETFDEFLRPLFADTK
jgi:cAMP-dependent protein kinase regulator